MNKKMMIALGIAAASFSTLTATDFSANVAITSDYVWRGVSQTDSNPAIQGGFDLEHESGFSLGTWGSNVAGSANAEFDIYGAYAMDLEGINFSVGFIVYTYSDDSSLDFEEGNIGASYGPFSAMISHDFDNDNTYIEAAYDYEITDSILLSAHMGEYSFDNDGDYTDWSISASTEYNGFGFSLAYIDTDISNFDAADSRIAFSISKSL